jgi:hypothetical protein
MGESRLEEMGRACAIAVCVAVAAAFTGSANSRVQVPTGDTCTYSASGAAYGVSIVTGSNVQQFGFAFGAPGLTFTNVGISGQNGGFTTAKLPANTSGAWISDTQLNGNLVVTLTGNGNITGPIVVVPSSEAQSSYFDPITCSVATSSNTGGATAKNLSFTVGSRATYSAAARGWHLVVTIPAAGTVSAKQPLATTIKQKPKPLVQAKQESLNSRGAVTLLLKVTPQGQGVLAVHHILRVKLTVTVDSRDGREAHKTVNLTLRK